MCIRLDRSPTRRQFGFSLVETIIFIVIVSVGIVGLLSTLQVHVKHSADPMLRKQVVAIAESLLEEVMLQPFTTCDPEAFDPDTGACAQNEVMGPDTVGANPAQTRYSLTHPFNNVNDYHSFGMPSGIFSINDGGTSISGLEAYQAAVTVTEAGGEFGLAAAEALRIDVTVTDPAGEALTLTGYRFKYEPLP